MLEDGSYLITLNVKPWPDGLSNKLLEIFPHELAHLGQYVRNEDQGMDENLDQTLADAEKYATDNPTGSRKNMDSIRTKLERDADAFAEKIREKLIPTP